MRTRAVATGAAMALIFVTAVRAEQAPDVENTSFVLGDGTRTLQESIVINAPVSVLWKGFTEAAEFEKWNSPLAAIDLRVGGSLEASYKRNAKIGDPDNIRNRIITYLPEQLIVFQNIQAPRDFPDRDLFQKTVTILQFAPLGAGQTRVTVSSTGYGPGDGFARVYGFFEKNNAQVLESYKHTYEKPAAAVAAGQQGESGQ